MRENTKEYRDREAEAARMARDIEKNPEFRTRNNERDLTDEEEAFSEVKRERIPHSATEYRYVTTSLLASLARHFSVYLRIGLYRKETLHVRFRFDNSSYLQVVFQSPNG